jgi:dihydroorotase
MSEPGWWSTPSNSNGDAPEVPRSFAAPKQNTFNSVNSSPANYSFFMGTSNDNEEEVLKTNDKKEQVCGIKIFMGSSTGNMLVDNHLTLDNIFRKSELLIATHCEDERIIKSNLERIQSEKEILEASDHPRIRDVEGCFESSLMAVQLAKRNNTRLHILHISTAKELQLFSNMIPLEDKRITSEVCVHHLHFTADDYALLGNKIKCNPAIKSKENKEKKDKEKDKSKDEPKKNNVKKSNEIKKISS